MIWKNYLRKIGEKLIMPKKVKGAEINFSHYRCMIECV
jgi:hypothetical protein